MRLCLEDTHTRESKKMLILLLFARLIVSLPVVNRFSLRASGNKKVLSDEEYISVGIEMPKYLRCEDGDR